MIRQHRIPPWGVYLLIFLIAWIIRGLYIAETCHQVAYRYPLVDAGEYHSIAKTWAAGQRALDKLAWQPWFFPLTLAQLYKLTGPSVLAGRLLQSVIGALICVLTAALAFRLWPRPVIRWIAGLVAALYGPAIHYDTDLLAEPWATFWLVAATWVAFLYWQKPRGLLATALGTLGALMLFTRPPLAAAWPLLLCVANSVWFHARRPPLRTAAADAGLTVVGFFAIAIPFIHVITQATGTTRFLPVSTSINFYIGNSAHPCETINIRPGYAWDNLIFWPELHGAHTDAEKDDFYRQQTLRAIRANPRGFLRNLALKTCAFVSSREIPRNVDLYVLRNESRLLRLLVWKIHCFGFPFGLLLGCATIGLWATRPRSWGIAIVLAGYAAAVIIIHVCDRYRLPVVPLFIVLASGGILALADTARRCNFKALVGEIAVISLVATAASWGGPYCAEQGNYHAELFRLIATTAFEQGDFKTAEDCARQAVALNPQEAQAWNQLGLLAIRRGATDEAENDFRLATNADSACCLAWFNLANIASAHGRTDEAITDFRAGLAQSPAYLPAWIDLGDLYMKTDRTAEAQNCYRTTLRIRPGFAPGFQRLEHPLRVTAPARPSTAHPAVPTSSEPGSANPPLNRL